MDGLAYHALAIFSGVIILGMIVAIVLCLHLAYTKLDEILDSLKNCSAVMNRSPLRHGGPLGKLLLVGGVSGIVTFPSIYLRYGGVNLDDLRKMSPSIRRRLEVIQWLLIADIVGIVACYLMLKFFKF